MEPNVARIRLVIEIALVHPQELILTEKFLKLMHNLICLLNVSHHQICINQTCRDIEQVFGENLRLCPMDERGNFCSRHGICSTANKCHCHQDWVGHDCSQRVDSSLLKSIPSEQRTLDMDLAEKIKAQAANSNINSGSLHDQQLTFLETTLGGNRTLVITGLLKTTPDSDISNNGNSSQVLSLSNATVATPIDEVTTTITPNGTETNKETSTTVHERKKKRGWTAEQLVFILVFAVAGVYLSFVLCANSFRRRGFISVKPDRVLRHHQINCKMDAWRSSMLAKRLEVVNNGTSIPTIDQDTQRMIGYTPASSYHENKMIGLDSYGLQGANNLNQDEQDMIEQIDSSTGQTRSNPPLLTTRYNNNVSTIDESISMMTTTNVHQSTYIPGGNLIQSMVNQQPENVMGPSRSLSRPMDRVGRQSSQQLETLYPMITRNLSEQQQLKRPPPPARSQATRLSEPRTSSTGMVQQLQSRAPISDAMQASRQQSNPLAGCSNTITKETVGYGYQKTSAPPMDINQHQKQLQQKDSITTNSSLEHRDPFWSDDGINNNEHISHTNVPMNDDHNNNCNNKHCPHHRSMLSIILQHQSPTAIGDHQQPSSNLTAIGVIQPQTNSSHHNGYHEEILDALAIGQIASDDQDDSQQPQQRQQQQQQQQPLQSSQGLANLQKRRLNKANSTSIDKQSSNMNLPPPPRPPSQNLNGGQSRLRTIASGYHHHTMNRAVQPVSLIDQLQHLERVQSMYQQNKPNDLHEFFSLPLSVQLSALLARSKQNTAKQKATVTPSSGAGYKTRKSIGEEQALEDYLNILLNSTVVTANRKYQNNVHNQDKEATMAPSTVQSKKSSSYQQTQANATRQQLNNSQHSLIGGNQQHYKKGLLQGTSASQPMTPSSARPQLKLRNLQDLIHRLQRLQSQHQAYDSSDQDQNPTTTSQHNKQPLKYQDSGASGSGMSRQRQPVVVYRDGSIRRMGSSRQGVNNAFRSRSRFGEGNSGSQHGIAVIGSGPLRSDMRDDSIYSISDSEDGGFITDSFTSKTFDPSGFFSKSTSPLSTGPQSSSRRRRSYKAPFKSQAISSSSQRNRTAADEYGDGGADEADVDGDDDEDEDDMIDNDEDDEMMLSSWRTTLQRHNHHHAMNRKKRRSGQNDGCEKQSSVSAKGALVSGHHSTSVSRRNVKSNLNSCDHDQSRSSHHSLNNLPLGCSTNDRGDDENDDDDDDDDVSTNTNPEDESFAVRGHKYTRTSKRQNDLMPAQTVGRNVAGSPHNSKRPYQQQQSTLKCIEVPLNEAPGDAFELSEQNDNDDNNCQDSEIITEKATSIR